MAIVAINGSARRGGNTAQLIAEVFAPLEDAGYECEMIELAGKTIGGCTACGRCSIEKDGICYGRKDDGNDVITALLAADALLIGSPVYYGDITAETKAIIDRLGRIANSTKAFVRKPGAGVVAVRRAGAMHALDSINHFFGIQEMFVVSSSYWNIGIGREKGEVAGDEEGIRTMRRLGENMAFLLSRLEEK